MFRFINVKGRVRFYFYFFYKKLNVFINNMIFEDIVYYIDFIIFFI